MAKKHTRPRPVGRTKGKYETTCTITFGDGFEFANQKPLTGDDLYRAMGLPVPPKPLPPFMSTDSAVRKNMPVASGVLAYFPDALLCVAWISKVGNDKPNPGQPLHWAKEKSTDEPDCEVRHMLDHLRGLEADPGLEPLGELGHLASKAWRALAHLQRASDAERAKHAKRGGK